MGLVVSIVIVLVVIVALSLGMALKKLCDGFETLNKGDIK